MPTHRRHTRVACATALALAASASTALGAAWLPVEAVSSGTYPEDFWLEVGRPLLAADGTAYLTWSEAFAYGPDAPQLSRRPARGAWTTLTDPPTGGLGGVMRYPFAGDGGAALDGRGRLHVAMPAGRRTADGADLAVSVATLRDDGGWTAEGTQSCGAAAANECLDAAHVAGPGNQGLAGTPLAMLPDGRAVVAWPWVNVGTNRMRVSLRSAAGVWSAAADIATSATTPFTDPAVAIAPSGEAAVAWSADRNGTAPSVQVRTQKGGVWMPVRTLGPSSGPPVVAAGDGYIAAAWRTPQGRLAITRRTAAGTWQTLPSVAAMDEYPKPFIGVNPGGAVLVVWQSGATVRSAYIAPTSGTPMLETVATNSVLWDVTRPANGRTAVAVTRGGSVAVVRAGASGGWTAPMAVDSRVFDQTSMVRIASDDFGDLLLAWWHGNGSHAVPPFTDEQGAWAATYDVTPPVLSAVNVPTRAALRTTVAVSASAADTLSAPGAIRWSFGDGGTATGPSASHAYTRTGTFTVTARVADGAANESVATRRITIAR